MQKPNRKYFRKRKIKSCTRFLLQSTFYDQIDDVTLCTPFYHVLANFFIATNETM